MISPVRNFSTLQGQGFPGDHHGGTMGGMVLFIVAEIITPLILGIRGRYPLTFPGY